MKQLLIAVLLVLLSYFNGIGQAADTVLTLDECYEILYSENPVMDKIELNRKITNLNRQIAKTGWYPDLQLNASASYQSDIVEFPFESPNFEIPTFSKDHYNISLDVTQPLFDGGRTNASKKLEEQSGTVAEASLEVDLLNIKEQVDRIYFGILILQKQSEINKLIINELAEQLDMVKSQVENGVLLPGNEASLRAEILRREQELTKTEFDLIAGYQSLSDILGTEIKPGQILKLPEKENWQFRAIESLRPELEMIDSRKNLLDVQQNLAEADKRPVISLFARPMYGRPGFNFFDNDLQFNWIVGVQARWNLKNARNASIRSELLNLQKRKLSEDRALFKRNQHAELSRIGNQINTIDEQIKRDREIVDLQREVAEEKRSLAEQGAAHITEYISAMNAQSRAQLQLELRKIQKIQAIINYETEQGWTWN